jgi:hypothetical protein
MASLALASALHLVPPPVAGAQQPVSAPAQPVAAEQHPGEPDRGNVDHTFAWVGSGTARAPRSSVPHGLSGVLGAWSVMFGGALSINHRWDPQPRGESDLFQTSMVMVSAQRQLGPGLLKLHAMASVEPLMGPAGRSLLLQTGETADGATPLIDRQHPHDAVMSLGASYRLPLRRGVWALVYAAPVGSPALGPVPYMHRASAGGSPTVPISHHFLDATHVSHGVLTAAVFNDLFQLEVSAFNGREPDEHRWQPDPLALNSYSARLTLTPGESWALQASMGALAEPERLHSGIDLRRLTVSLMSDRRIGPARWATTLAWGRNMWQSGVVTYYAPTVAPPASLAVVSDQGTTHLPPDRGGEHSGVGGTVVSVVPLPERSQDGWLAETSLEAWEVTAFGRYERTLKDEMYPPSDPRHSAYYSLSKLEVGVRHDLRLGGFGEVGIGGTVSFHGIPSRLARTYGDDRRSYMVFIRFALAGPSVRSGA